MCACSTCAQVHQNATLEPALEWDDVFDDADTVWCVSAGVPNVCFVRVTNVCFVGLTSCGS